MAHLLLATQKELTPTEVWKEGQAFLFYFFKGKMWYYSSHSQTANIKDQFLEM